MSDPKVTSAERFAVFKLSPDDGRRWVVCDEACDPVKVVAQFATPEEALADAESRNANANIAAMAAAGELLW